MSPELKGKILNLIQQDHKKEYLCHIQYVLEIGLRLAKQYNVDSNIIEAACLLHDIGRDKELPGEDHAQTSRRMAEEILKDSDFTEEQKQKIFACILAHGSEEIPKSTEEQIVRTADAGSKVEYHEAFILMCKKATYEERLAWGSKYLEKGYKNISFEDYKKTVESKYLSIKKVYNQISRLI